jgi:hypothetical protein
LIARKRASVAGRELQKLSITLTKFSNAVERKEQRVYLEVYAKCVRKYLEENIYFFIN